MQARFGRWLSRAPDLFAAATVAGAGLSALIGVWAWPLSSALHFFEWSGLAWSVGAALAIKRGSGAWVAAHVGLLGLWLALISPQISRTHEAAGPPAANEFRVVSFNVGNGRADPHELCAALEELDADLVLLQELNHAQAAALEARGDALALHRELRPGGRRGKGVLSRFPLAEIRHVVGTDGATRVHGVVRTPLGDLAFVNVHARATVALLGPLTDFDDQVREIARGAPRDRPVIVAGDFNLGPHSELLTPLSRAGFENAFTRHGAGLGLSFPVFGRYWGLPVPPLVRIDHVFTRGLKVGAAQLGASAGSDHRALIVCVTLPWKTPQD
jgi:vancomycin resistance protein VanJ